MWGKARRSSQLGKFGELDDVLIDTVDMGEGPGPGGAGEGGGEGGPGAVPEGVGAGGLGAAGERPYACVDGEAKGSTGRGEWFGLVPAATDFCDKRSNKKSWF